MDNIHRKPATYGVLLKSRALHGDAQGNYRHFRASCLAELSQVVSPVRVKQSYPLCG